MKTQTCVPDNYFYVHILGNVVDEEKWSEEESNYIQKAKNRDVAVLSAITGDKLKKSDPHK